MVKPHQGSAGVRKRERVGEMGNISVIVLGDLMQMCPISGRYIFLEPRDEQFSFSYQIRFIPWKMIK